MAERAYDRALQIKTIGIREWKDPSLDFNRYEATPYRALDILFQHYKLRKTDQVVDFGCGRGRVAFYIHDRFQVPVTGIEANDLTYEEALLNKARYRQRAKHIKAPLRFEFGLAEHYQVKPTENCFYFFNPFAASTFKKVVDNILQSVAEAPRPVDIILYYPLPKYKKILQKGSPFRLLNKIKVPRAQDPLEKFLIYRHDKHD
ncbi:MAG: class I SAM-dependent methyltransferase [Firmicutes bacterium]|nr:class I SAM-dependent methyltransferase [Bacillota bacterium]